MAPLVARFNGASMAGGIAAARGSLRDSFVERGDAAPVPPCLSTSVFVAPGRSGLTDKREGIRAPSKLAPEELSVVVVGHEKIAREGGRRDRPEMDCFQIGNTHATPHALAAKARVV